MKVIIQHRHVVHVEQITAVVDDVDSTFVLVEGQLIRVSERYRTHVKDAVYYWKGLFRKSNNLLKIEINHAWNQIQEEQSNTSETLDSDEVNNGRLEEDNDTLDHKHNRFSTDDETTESDVSTHITTTSNMDSTDNHSNRTDPPDEV